MKLLISQLIEGPNSFHFESQRDSWMGEVAARVGKAGHKVLSPLVADLSLTKLEPDYYLRGQMSFEVEQSCARCAEAFTLPIQHSFDVALAHVEHGRVKSVEIAGESEELDVNFFDGNEIELGPIVEEQFFLSLPYQAVCKDSCKGICQQCGKNLNVEPCACATGQKLSPFSILHEYKLS